MSGKVAGQEWGPIDGTSHHASHIVSCLFQPRTLGWKVRTVAERPTETIKVAEELLENKSFFQMPQEGVKHSPSCPLPSQTQEG